MDLRKLEVFNEVMLTGSVSKAGRNLGRTQPAISSQIAGLEEEVGYKLFERRGGRLHPVPEAHFLHAETREILTRLNSLQRTMREAGTLEAGHLRVASMPVHAEFLIPRLISRFVRDRPDVSVTLVSQSSGLVFERMASQQFDIGFAEYDAGSPLVNTSVIEMDCVCAVAATDPLSRLAQVTPEDLDGRPAALFLSDHFISRRLREIFEVAGANLYTRFEMQNAAAQYVFVEEGLGYAVMSPLSAWIYRVNRPDHAKIRFLPFKPQITYRAAVLTPTHKPLSRLALAFADALEREVRWILDEGLSG